MKAVLEKMILILVITAALMLIVFSAAESAHAMGNIDEGVTGTCKWELYNDGTPITTLKISAKDPHIGGAMDDYKYDSKIGDINTPWLKYKDTVDQIIFSNVIKIGDYSFYNFKGISRISIGGVQSIGSHAFAFCVNVGEIIIKGDDCVIEDDAFAFCENVRMKQVVLEGVRTIGETAFEEIDCENLSLGEGLETIGDGAFNNNEALQMLTIPGSCTSIGNNAFIACPELKVVFIKNPACTLYQYSFDKDYNTALVVRKNSTALDYAEHFGFRYNVAGDNGTGTLDLSGGDVTLSVDDVYGSEDYVMLYTLEVLISTGKIKFSIGAGGAVCDIDQDGIWDITYGPGEAGKVVVMKELPGRSIGGAVTFEMPAEFEKEAEEEGAPYYGTFTFKLNKAANLLYAKGKTKTVKYSALRKKTQTLGISKVMTIKNPKGTLSFKKQAGSKKITINKKTGKVSVKKGLKKGTYPVRVTVFAAGNDQYEAGSKTVTIKIKVK